MNRITELFEKKQKNILSIYFTAGFPHLCDTADIIKELQANGIDLIEIGIRHSLFRSNGRRSHNSGKRNYRPEKRDDIEQIVRAAGSYP